MQLIIFLFYYFNSERSNKHIYIHMVYTQFMIAQLTARDEDGK